MQGTMKRTVVVAILSVLCAGCLQVTSAPAPAPDPPSPAQLVAPGVYVCYNPYGAQIPQPQPLCPPGWTGTPPANPLPLPPSGPGIVP